MLAWYNDNEQNKITENIETVIRYLYPDKQKQLIKESSQDYIDFEMVE